MGFVMPERVAKAQMVKVRVPSSVANMGAGFDVHSIALQSPEIRIQLSRTRDGSKTIEVEGRYADDITSDPKLNAAGKAIQALVDQFGIPDEYALKIQTGIPPKKGLGLSGAEAVGAVVCADRMFKLSLDKRTIVDFAAKAEPSHHLDNVTAAALGGFNIVTRTPTSEYPHFTTIRPPKELGVAIIVPDIEKTSTEATRQVLPSSVPFEQHVRSMSYIAAISAAFARGDVSAILEIISWDPVVEPTRADSGAYGRGITAENLQEEKRLLLKKYHVAETISGAGPARALWYDISENNRTLRKDGVGLIKPAVDLVSDRLAGTGHRVQEIFVTRPSSKHATIVYEGSAAS